MQVDNGGGIGTFVTDPPPSPIEKRVGKKTQKKSEILVCPCHPCGVGGCFCLAADWSAEAQAAVFTGSYSLGNNAHS